MTIGAGDLVEQSEAERAVSDAETMVDFDEENNPAAPPTEQPVSNEQGSTGETGEAETDAILDALLGRIGDVAQVSPYTKAMIFGQPGAGKTVFCATSPNTLIVDVERGALSVANHPEFKNNAKFLEFVSVFQLEQLIRYLKDDHPAFKQYETVVVDTFTTLQAKDLDEIVRAEAAKDASRSPFLPIGTDYNVNTRHMQQIAQDLREINKNIIVTCHVNEVKDDTTGIILKRPELTPKLVKTMNGIFDVVGYLNVDDGRRTLQVHPTKEIGAKTRLDGLPPVIESPTFQMLLDAKKKTLENN